MTDKLVTLGRKIEAALRRGDTETAKSLADQQREIVERIAEAFGLG